MAVLDRFIKAMSEKEAQAVVLETGSPVMLDIDGERSPITKDPLKTPMIVAFLKEIMPDGMRQQLDSGDGRVTFGYLHRGVEVDINVVGKYIAAVISPAKRRPSQAISMPAAALLMDAPEPFSAPSEQPAVKSDRDSIEAVARGEDHIHKLLSHLVDAKSSDLHLRVGMRPTYRTQGELSPLEGTEPLTRDDIDGMLRAIMPDRNKSEFAKTHDTDFAYEIVDLARFRVNALWDRRGPAAVFRMISTNIQSADELGLSDPVQRLCQLTKGFVLVTGPTGCGKSTTLATMIDLINQTRTDHVITIEDPIEFVHPNKKCIITQRQVGHHTPSFKRALRAALREDPDIILIGEMRDLETVSIALETAETGHLVFGTMHTTTAASTIDRIIDQFPSDQQDQVRVMLSESLKAVITQVLLKTKDGGRVAAREVLLVTPAIANLIRQGKTFQIKTIIQTNRRIGMVSLSDALADLVKKGVVTPEEAYVKAADKPGLEVALKQMGITLNTPQAIENIGEAPAA